MTISHITPAAVSHMASLKDAEEIMDYIYGRDVPGSAARSEYVCRWGAKLGAADGPLFWDVIQKAWPSFDRIPHFSYEYLFYRFSSSLAPVIFEGSITVYRGQNGQRPSGLSWTRSEAVAAGFARGHRGIYNPKPKILSLDVTADQVAFAVDGRQEEELVLRSIPIKGWKIKPYVPVSKGQLQELSS